MFVNMSDFLLYTIRAKALARRIMTPKASVEKRGLFLVGHGTGSLVNLYLVLVVDIAQDVITRDGVAAVLELILANGILADEDWFLAVELLGHNEELLLGDILDRFLLVTTQEGYQFAPAALASGDILARKLVEVFLAQQDSLVAQRLIEVFQVCNLMEDGQLTDDLGFRLDLVLLQEFRQQCFTLLLQLTTVAAQDGLNLALGLGRTDEVDP